MKQKKLVEKCDASPLALNNLEYWCDRQRTPLRERDRPGNDPQWVPGSLSCCPWMFPDQLRNKSEPVGSKEVHQVQTKHRKCVTPFG